MSVKNLYVVGNGAVTSGWRDEGGDYTRVDDNPTNDGDTTTLYTPVLNSVASFALASGSFSSETINSITVHAVIKRIDPPANSIGLGFVLGGSQYVGTNVDTTTNGAYQDLSTTFTLNPATALPWTAAEANALDVLIKKTAAGNAYRLTQMYATADYSEGGTSSRSYLGFF